MFLDLDLPGIVVAHAWSQSVIEVVTPSSGFVLFSLVLLFGDGEVFILQV